jgi:hypothetical protein
MSLGALSPAVLSLVDLEVFDPRAPAGSTKRRFCCPLPACAGKPLDAAHRSLELEPATGWWTCYRCEAHGRLREHWRSARVERLVRIRRAFAPADRSASLPRAAMATERSPFDWHAAYECADTGSGSAGARYLLGRRVPLHVAAAAGVRFTRAWYGRPAALFPVRDRAGELVAVSGRCIDDRTPPTLTGGPKSGGVFATPAALAAEPLVITEAPIDALSLAAAGVPAVALCGKSSPAWLPELCAFRSVVLALDGDQAGDAAATTLAGALHTLGARVERWRPTAGKDWNELVQRYGVAALQSALTVIAPHQEQTEAGPAAGPCACCGSYAWRPLGAPAQGWVCAACQE